MRSCWLLLLLISNDREVYCLLCWGFAPRVSRRNECHGNCAAYKEGSVVGFFARRKTISFGEARLIVRASGGPRNSNHATNLHKAENTMCWCCACTYTAEQNEHPRRTLSAISIQRKRQAHTVLQRQRQAFSGGPSGALPSKRTLAISVDVCRNVHYSAARNDSRESLAKRTPSSTRSQRNRPARDATLPRHRGS